MLKNNIEGEVKVEKSLRHYWRIIGKHDLVGANSFMENHPSKHREKKKSQETKKEEHEEK